MARGGASEAFDSTCVLNCIFITNIPFSGYKLDKSACPLMTSVAPPTECATLWSACHPISNCTPHFEQCPSVSQ
jgi:hypothetical protein